MSVGKMAFDEMTWNGKIDELKDNIDPGNTKGGSITVPLTSCLIGLD